MAVCSPIFSLLRKVCVLIFAFARPSVQLIQFLNLIYTFILSGIANGFPLSAIGTRNELSAQLTPGGMGGRFILITRQHCHFVVILLKLRF